MATPPPLIIVVGPTAVGKSRLALALAERVGGEIVAADSMQVYRGLDIGTAKSGADEQGRVPHHLLDLVDPDQRFTAADYARLARTAVADIRRRGHVPIMVGGTGLYISSVVDNFSIPRVPGNTTLRRSLEEKTNEELIALLRRMDPEAALNIDQRNKRRVIRALEVCILSGGSFSDQRQKGEPLFDVLEIGPRVPREILHARISERVDSMIEKGLLDEIQKLISRKYGWSLSSMNGIGYRQFKDYFEAKETLTEAVEILKRDTRRFARRQMTWFKSDTRIQWVDSYEDCERLVEEFLKS